ncbi:methyl-accepting chemotaxis protein [Agarivorans sp. 1_MG-2023]|uniref:methyl-accepting chemotaxis protein n=1 Tax=Agarivorans sp. 1_MG-2023 TaxID=3062634 RepID=UPI0026E48D18|nr:methyl-accepting chemotaxis protein [Agarivorans sp. 1_MG-2023]MDO6763070.1 methyl-accepting chemotaxis protein [Agarivorans sp. 1_MG-2023]
MNANPAQLADKQVLYILLAHLPVVGLLVPIGFASHGFALTMSMLISIIALLNYAYLRGSRVSSCINAMLLMVYSMVMIQAQLGRLEMHFHIFAALAFVLIYKDWLPVIAAAGIIAVHHLVFTYMQLSGVTVADVPLMIYATGCSWGTAIEHAAFVVFESGVLVFYAINMAKDAKVSNSIIVAVDKLAANKDLTATIDSNKEHPTVIAFNTLISEFNALFSDLKQSIVDINGLVSGLNQQSAETKNVVLQQMEQSDSVASASVELSQAARNVSDNAEHAAGAAESVETQIKSGSQQVGESVEATQTLNKLLSESEVYTRQLNDNVQGINAVIEVIKAISEQTNLLALNAAIEAARAGELGRGFAVVADEVRALAARTQKSTGEVNQIIDTLQTNASQVVDSMQKGLVYSDESKAKIETGGSTLSLINRSVSDMRDVNAQIASSTSEQTDACDQIERSINEIRDKNETLMGQSQLLAETASTVANTLASLEQRVAVYQTQL